MITERELLHQIINNDPNGIPGLFFRHAALFREALIRFRGKAGLDESEHLGWVILAVRNDLVKGRFDDMKETFYNWIVRRTWGEFLAAKMVEQGEEHVDPDLLYQCADKPNEADLTSEGRSACETHLKNCAFCRDLAELCKGIPLEIRHAGAPCPEEFLAVRERVIEQLKSIP